MNTDWVLLPPVHEVNPPLAVAYCNHASAPADAQAVQHDPFLFISHAFDPALRIAVQQLCVASCLDI